VTSWVVIGGELDEAKGWTVMGIRLAEVTGWIVIAGDK
jgi:hypothetical protein